MLTLYTDYTKNSHFLLVADEERRHKKYEDFPNAASAVTWCSKCKLGPGWLIKNYGLNKLKKDLKINNIKYKIIEAPRKAATVKKTNITQKLHPSYEVMVAKAIKDIKDRKGASRQAIKRYIEANFRVPDRFDSVFRTQLNRLINNGKILQVNSQRFKLSDELKNKH